MNKKKYRFIWLASCCFIYLFSASSAFAWARHNLMSRDSLKDVSWLKHFDQIFVSAYKYQSDNINPEFELLYSNPEIEYKATAPKSFTYYDLGADHKYGFQGMEPGKKISALQILVDFSDEPDWGMDKKLDLGLGQKFMGGSQGYRHMYYPSGSFHLPQPFFSQGKAPERAAHFYQMARRAFEQGDSYWGFRFLARSMHYIQDLAQPYHTTQLAWGFFHVSSPLDGTTETTKNYHFAYESLVAHILELEASGELPADYRKIFEQTPALSADNVEALALKIAEKSQQLSGATFDICRKLLGDELFAKHSVPLTAEQVKVLLKHPQRAEFDRLAKDALKLVAAGSKGLLELAHKDFFPANARGKE